MEADHPFQPFGPAFRLAGALARLVAADILLGAAQFGLLGVVFGQLAFQAVGFQAQVAGVRGRVIHQRAVFQVERARSHPVEEAPVVRGAEQRAAPRRQERFEPFDGVQVEVIGRLIEQEQIGATQ